MKKLIIRLAITSAILTGCDSAEVKEKKRLAHLASLTCESSREGRTQEELQAIGDACFKRGSFHKSSGRKW